LSKNVVERRFAETFARFPTSIVRVQVNPRATEVILRFGFLILIPVCTQVVTTPAAIPIDPPPSAFLPPVGQSVHYRYSGTVMAPKGPKSEAGRLTLTSVAGNKLQLTMAGDGKGSRNLEFQVDETGALHPASMREPATQPSGKPGRSGNQ
jgi:hypothetical protein